jgi:hypothetical protein
MAAAPHASDLDIEAAPLNEKDAATLAELRRQLGAQTIDALPESMVVRFVRGYSSEKEPVKETVERVREVLKFRATHGVDHILDHLPRKLALFKKLWHFGIYGRDKLGHPIYVERIGMIEPSTLLENFKLEDIEHFHVYMMEALCRLKENHSALIGRRMYKHLVIMDLAGLGLKHVSDKFRGPMGAIVHIDQHYYPESLYKMIIINAPWVFRVVWSFVQPRLHKVTQERIKMGEEHLREYIDEDQIPDFLGGKYKTADVNKLIVPPNGSVRFLAFLMGSRPGPGRESAVQRSFFRNPLFKPSALACIQDYFF